jgi:nicotinate-nucleotide pyrophosphorylase (carboxylating)
LIKDNHVLAAGGVTPAIAAVRATAPGLALEVECDTVAQVGQALEAGCDLILLDNMAVADLRASVALAAAHARRHGGGTRRVRLEASGGLTLANAAEVAATGVDYVAVGGLTHSSPALDLGLDLRGA